MSFAMQGHIPVARPTFRFQFPFRRDELCNGIMSTAIALQQAVFQFPFRRDELCNSIENEPKPVKGAVSIPFSSG